MYINRKYRNYAVILLLMCISHHSLVFSQSAAQLIPKKGLHVTTNGLPWLTGSEISFFTPDKKHHHYYFTWWEQDSHVSKPGHERLFIGSTNTAVNGVYLLEQEGNKIRTFFDCKWNLKEPGVADIIYAKIWLPYFSEAVFSSATQNNITDWGTFHDNRLQVQTPFGTFQFYTASPFKVKTDANFHPGEKDYTRRSQYLILYEDNIPVTDSPMLSRAFFIEELNNAKASVPETKETKVVPEKIKVAWQPDEQKTLLLPKPKSISWQPGKYTIPENKTSNIQEVVKTFRNLLGIQWQIGDRYFPVIKTSVNKSLPEEGYFIEVSKSGVNIQHHTQAGLQHALHTLVQLVKNENGHLLIPFVKIKDWPSVSWRGIHMFTGPSSWLLHKQMYERVLLPLKMNKVVLQCEQAEWTSRPELHNSISVPMQDLKAEFDYLRKNFAEPIPLIQSLGHMEWFFKPKQNRWMAVNPEYPYTLNPTLPLAQQAVKQLWDETFDLLQPQTMHIGFDEIGMIGFNQPREKEVEYFQKQIGFLNTYAKSKNAKLMLWGDMGLAPGEGPDALNGINKERAATIRSFIPKGSYVADWHYINNPNPEIYKPNLKIWKQNNNLPLASPWLWPNNVRGFVQAAIDEKAGVLQTTWADFESSEKNMLLNIEQFGAYVLAMDYAWSGRKELPEQLPYNATEEWIKRFYSQARPVKVKAGINFPVKLQMKDETQIAKRALPDSVLLHTGVMTSSGFKIDAVSTTILPEGTPVAEILFMLENKITYRKVLHYGADIRSGTDMRMVYNNEGRKDIRVLFFSLQSFMFDKIKVNNLHPASGLTISGLVLID